MSDVLTAAQVQEIADYPKSGDPWKSHEAISALARSHEQLRGERDDAQAMYRHERKFQLRQADEIQAAVRAGGNAAALREAAKTLVEHVRTHPSGTVWREDFEALAEALDAS